MLNVLKKYAHHGSRKQKAVFNTLVKCQMKNRKSLLTLTAIVEILVAIVLFLIVLSACNKIRDAFSSNEDKYTASFQGFVNEINDMRKQKNIFEIELKEGSAIIGFSKAGVKWECINCNRQFDKPTNPQCTGNACACLCLEGFKYENNLGRCGTSLICKPLEKNIAEKTYLNKNNPNTYWKNGFLFVNGIRDANGLSDSIIYTNPFSFFVNNDDGTVTVCNPEMNENNEGTCTPTIIN